MTRYVVLATPRQWSIQPLARADDARYRRMARIAVVNVPKRCDTVATLCAIRDDLIGRVTWA